MYWQARPAVKAQEDVVPCWETEPEGCTSFQSCPFLQEHQMLSLDNIVCLTNNIVHCFHLLNCKLDPSILVYIKQSQKYQALSKCSRSFQSIFSKNKAFKDGLLSKQDIYIEMGVNVFENSLKSSKYLAILITNFIKNTVYIDIQTVKVIKKNRQ